MFRPDPIQAAVLSVQVGLWCVLLGAVPAVALGWLLARRRFVGKSALGTLLLAPLVLPPVVTGIVLLELFSPVRPFGAWLDGLGIHIPFTMAGAVIAAVVVGLPLYVLAVRHAFEAVDRRYEEVALTLGRSPRQTFWRVTLPLALPGIFAGALLAFARGLGEFGATSVLAGNTEGKTRTLSLALYTLLESPEGEGASLKLLWLSLGLAFTALLAYSLLSRWQRRRLELEA